MDTAIGSAAPTPWNDARHEAFSRMTSSPSPELSDAEKDAHFLALFGKTPDQVRAEGVDPDDYAIQHIREAMNNDKIAAQMLAPSAYARRMELRWLSRGSVAILVGFGFLFLSLIKHLYLIAIVLAFIDLVVVMVFTVIDWRYWIRHLRANRVENIRSWVWHMREQRQPRRPKSWRA